jgi:hypothetical protein
LQHLSTRLFLTSTTQLSMFHLNHNLQQFVNLCKLQININSRSWEKNAIVRQY